MQRKTLTLILVLLVLGLIWFLLMFIPKPLETTPVPEQPIASNASSTPQYDTMCYLKHIDAAAGSDDTYLEVSFKPGMEDVFGKFNILPAEKDKLTGPFTGKVTVATTSYGIITVDHTYTAEGINATEKRVFRLRENEADVSFDLGQTYTLTLPQIDCTTASSSVRL